MPTYTVKAGDTLSAIGARNGVDWRSITGYRSGNPNLIYPGEVVSWGGGNSSPAPAAPVAQPAGNNWEQETSNMYNEVGNFDKNAKNPIDIYNATLERLGISDARTRVTDLRQQLLNTENLIRNVTGDVQGRTMDANLSENQRRRLVAQEQEPLVGQAGVQGRNLEMATADYNAVMAEGKAQTEMEYKGQADARAALMDRLRIAIDRADNETKKRQWQAEFDRLKAKDAEEARRWEAEQALRVQAERRAATSAASASKAAAGVSGATQNQISSLLNSKKGKDSFVSPETYRQGMQMWANAGGSPDAYNSLYGGYVNPVHQKLFGGYY